MADCETSNRQSTGIQTTACARVQRHGLPYHDAHMTTTVDNVDSTDCPMRVSSRNGFAAEGQIVVSGVNDKRSFTTSKIGFYELMLQQLIDDGFNDVADKITSATNLSPASTGPRDCLFTLYEKLRFSTNLACAALLDTDLNSQTAVRKYDDTIMEGKDSRRPIDPTLLKKFAEEIAGAYDIEYCSRCGSRKVCTNCGLVANGPSVAVSQPAVRWATMALPSEPAVTDMQFDQDAIACSGYSYTAGSYGEPKNKNLKFRVTEQWAAAHKANCTTIACTADAKLCASGGEDNAVRVMTWRGTDTHKSMSSRSMDGGRGGRVWTTVFTDHQSPITCMTFHPTAPVLFSASVDGFIKIFNLGSQSLRRATATMCEISEMNCLKVHPCGEYLLMAGVDSIIRLYDLNYLQTYTTLHSHQHHFGPVNDIDCATSGSVFVSSSSDGSVKFWDAVANRVINCFPTAHSGLSVRKAKFSRSNLYLISSGLDGATRIWDLRMGRELMAFGVRPKRSLRYNVSNFLSDERYVANVNSEAHCGDLSVYSSITGKLLSTLQTHPGRLSTFESVSQSLLVLTASSDFRCRLLELSIESASILSGDYHTTVQRQQCDSANARSGVISHDSSQMIDQEEINIDL